MQLREFSVKIIFYSFYCIIETIFSRNEKRNDKVTKYILYLILETIYILTIEHFAIYSVSFS